MYTKGVDKVFSLFKHYRAVLYQSVGATGS